MGLVVCFSFATPCVHFRVSSKRHLTRKKRDVPILSVMLQFVCIGIRIEL